MPGLPGKHRNTTHKCATDTQDVNMQIDTPFILYLKLKEIAV
jgi:hypothetical protein